MMMMMIIIMAMIMIMMGMVKIVGLIAMNMLKILIEVTFKDREDFDKLKAQRYEAVSAREAAEIVAKLQTVFEGAAGLPTQQLAKTEPDVAGIHGAMFRQTAVSEFQQALTEFAKRQCSED